MPDTPVHNVARRILDCFADLGYVETPSEPLTTTDRTVPFTNASITAFKPRMLAGDSLGKTCQIQTCFRGRSEYPRLFVFDMVTVTADAGHLAEICGALPRALLAGATWITPNRVEVAINECDTDLATTLRRSLSVPDIVIREVRSDCVPTRWTYGAGDQLTGRGLNFFIRHETEPCSPACVFGCACGRWQEIGQIVAIHGVHRDYVEAGFGVESLQATAYGGHIYDLPWIVDERRRLEDAGFGAAEAVHLLNLHRAVTSLTRSGARPGSRGPAHVMRRLVLRLIDLAGESGPWRDRVATVCTSKLVTDVVIAEGERRESLGRSAIAVAADVKRPGRQRRRSSSPAPTPTC
jgi:hypothetical protein